MSCRARPRACRFPSLYRQRQLSSPPRTLRATPPCAPWPDPLSLDELMDRTGMDAAALQARLLELELDGRVERLPGGLFQRLAQA